MNELTGIEPGFWNSLESPRDVPVNSKRNAYQPHRRYYNNSDDREYRCKNTSQESIAENELGMMSLKHHTSFDYKVSGEAQFIPLELSDPESDDFSTCDHYPSKLFKMGKRSRSQEASKNTFLESKSVFIGPLYRPASKPEERTETNSSFIGPHCQSALKTEQENKTDSVNLGLQCLASIKMEQADINNMPFIGPICRPSPATDQGSEKTYNSSESPHYKISTVELGNLTGCLRSENGMDYELRQFYKEIKVLEAGAEGKREEHKCKDENSQFHYPLDNYSIITDPRLEQTSSAYNMPFDNGPRSCQELDASGNTNSCLLNNTMQTMPLPHYECHLSQNIINPRGSSPFKYRYSVPHPGQGDIIPCAGNERVNFGYNDFQRHNLHRSSRPSNLEGVQFLDGSYGNKQQEQMVTKCNRIKKMYSRTINGPNDNYTDVPYQELSIGNTRIQTFSACERKLILLRGVPGSGKSTLARSLLDRSPGGLVFSTDDYFFHKDGYTYDVKLLGNAHNWNQSRARRAMDDGRSPIIIDNTNIQGWEMKPYVHMALERGYLVEFLEPDNWWKLKPHELAKRNKHGVPHEKISQMLERYECAMSVPIVMNSVEPPHRNANIRLPHPRYRWQASLDSLHHSKSFDNR
ncbi:hypothetical protein GDO86_004556 [Hymenochirus boettgeri]|uniref:NEDD4-binding protein 2-like 2 n=1 Tax=Hymenochirus boettgeri TaxID=247094 RepID=A0A8T2K8A1_9PIPI|nr:hypothetical protein GDO86_004556 [Hymenochirus boettgeri]